MGLFSIVLKLFNRNAYNNYLEKKVDYKHQAVYDCSTGEKIYHQEVYRLDTKDTKYKVKVWEVVKETITF
ncbi:MAG: hypothetical protein QXP53_02590 [Candidatus Pacearchaeota archaeon]